MSVIVLIATPISRTFGYVAKAVKAARVGRPMRRKASRRSELVKEVREKLMKGSKSVVKWVRSVSDEDLAFIYLKDGVK